MTCCDELEAGGCLHAPARRLTVTLCAVLMAACGGGGGGSAAPGPASSVDLVLTGTAATGTAIAGATVDAKCATGSASTTSAADGSFSITISGGAMPCLLRVTSGALVLHSMAAEAGQSARANITPVSDLAVARFASDVPAAYYAAFGAAAAPALTPVAAQAAVTAVIELLKPGGVDFSLGANVLTGPLLAAHDAVAGDAYDQRLDALKVAMTSRGLTQADLALAIARGSPGAGATVRTTVASLPPEVLLAAPAPNCASLRSGRYRIVVNADGGSAPATGVITVDAPALSFVNTLGQTESLTVTGACTFSNAAGGEIFVNKAGVAIARVSIPGDATLRAAVLFPEQTHAVAELAGDFNGLAFERTTPGGPIHLTSSGFSVDAVGKFTAINFCDDLRVCVAKTAATLPDLTLSSHASGGYNLTNTTAGYVDRAFAYRTGGGELMLVTLSTSGQIMFATRAAAVTLPPVGRVQQSWNLFAAASFTAPNPINLSKYTVTAVDVAAGTIARTAVVDFNTHATRPENLEINSLRTGYTHRLGPVTVPTSLGGSSTVAEFIALTMRGMDMSIVALPATNQFGISLVESSIP